MTTSGPGELRIGAAELARLPPGHSALSIAAGGSKELRSLPLDLHVRHRLDLSDCTSLESLPEGLTVGSLVVRGCTSLVALPERLTASFLDATGCASLARWPKRASIEHGHVILRDCVALTGLPSWLRRVAQLDLVGCSGIATLPEGLLVTSFVDVAGTAIRALPASLRNAELRWRGVVVDERIAFHPETITPAEVLGERNAELRRVLLSRIGYDAFLAAVPHAVLDGDEDPGGPRALLRVELADDEPLVCLVVQCPSTARRYVLRVPPSMPTCRHAAAWIAGFDNPDDYRPLVET